MSTATTADAGEAGTQEVKLKRKRGPLIIIAVAILAVSGGAGWWFTRGHAPAGEQHEEARPEHPPVYLPLDAITVNLQPEVGDQYLQTEINLKLADEKVVETVKQHMPEVRSRLLMLLSGKHASEVTSVEGKDLLRREVMQAVLGVVDPKAAAAEAAALKAAAAKPATDEHGAAAAAGEATVVAPEAAAGEEGHKAGRKDEADPHGAAASPILDVLFTSFIVQ